MSTTRPPIGIAARLGWVSFLNDCSSEVLARVLPLHLTLTLGASPAFVGVIEGLAESVAVLLKSLSGWLSDRHASRKGFVVGGYALSVAARACYLAAFSPALLGLSRVLDRVGKGLRGAPRDAMVADAAASGRAGRDFGLTRFLDTLGSMAGLGLVLLLGVGLGPLNATTFRLCAWIALPLGLATLVLLVFWVPGIPRSTRTSRRLDWHIPKCIRGYLPIVFLFGVANSSDAFLVIKAKQAGFGFREILGLFLVFNALAALLAVPIGRLSDRFGRVRFLALGWTVYAIAYAVMGLAMTRTPFALALLGYGAFYGLTEGVEKALLADLLPAEQRGTGFGAFQTALGLAALLASPLMGLMVTRFGTTFAFLVTGGTALLAMVSLVTWAGMRRKTPLLQIL